MEIDFYVKRKNAFTRENNEHLRRKMLKTYLIDYKRNKSYFMNNACTQIDVSLYTKLVVTFHAFFVSYQ